MPRITLMNGKQLVCFPKKELNTSCESDCLMLDATGQYLSFGKKRKREIQALEQPMQDALFQSKAFVLYKNREQIFRDSRMFLASVPVKNELAYIGTNGFKFPVLGAYLEWWEGNKELLTADKDGVPALIFQFAGSPLSGVNICHAVYEDGNTKQVSVAMFNKVWQSFYYINHRYAGAVQQCDSYTLSKVLVLLKESNNNRYKQ